MNLQHFEIHPLRNPIHDINFTLDPIWDLDTDIEDDEAELIPNRNNGRYWNKPKVTSRLKIPLDEQETPLYYN